MLGGLKRCLPEPLRRVARLFLAESDARYHLAWNLYGRLARLFCRSGGHADDRRQFSRFGYIEGTVPEDQLARLMASLQDLPTIGWTAEDCAPGYVADSSLEKIAEVYNRNHPHLRLDPESLSLIEQILGSISERVRSAMGCSWRGANVRLRVSRVTSGAEGPNTWHNDQMPTSINKILFYLTPPGTEYGTTELAMSDGTTRMIMGPAGHWCLFKNSQVDHRGLPPTLGDRMILEVTIGPAFRTDVTPFCPGINTQYPKHPWVRRRAN